MGRWQGLVDTAERITGVTVRPLAEVNRLAEAELELRGRQRELQDLAYTVLDYVGGSPQDMRAQERRSLAQRARVIHQQDPQYGGQVNLLNEFVLGRGVSKPQAVDEDVQKVIDRFWDDQDNRRVLTSHEGQVRFNTDLTLQSNVFPLVYDDGEDGAVKLGLLDHDTVDQAVRDDDNRLRVLYYFTRSRAKTWDPVKHGYKVSQDRSVIRYYEEFRNVQDAKRDDAQGLRTEPLPQIDPQLIGRGRVLHVAINRTLEQAFGVPEVARTIRWLTAYNDLMRARVDMAKAAASIIGKRKLKGGAAAMQQLASQALMQTGASATTPVDPYALGQSPRPGSIIEENDWVDHQPFSFNSGGAAAEADIRGVRGQLAVGSGWPDPYIGGEGGNLSTATQLELRVLKMVEARQQVLEDTFGTLVQRAIQRAVQVGALDRFRPMTEDERKREALKAHADAQAAAIADGTAAAQPMAAPDLSQFMPPAPSPVQQAERRRVVREAALKRERARRDRLRVQEYGGGGGGGGRGMGGATASDDPVSDEFQVDLLGPVEEPPEGYVARELEFQVSMPSPLRRSMTDLITAISTIAKTFDPNATNMELSRMLLGIALGEALEVEDPGAAVERIFPEGYVDPAVAAALGQPDATPSLPGAAFTPVPAPAAQGPVGADGQRHANPDNPYGAPLQARPPELAMQQALVEAFSDRRLVVLHSRGGDPMGSRVQEAIIRRARARAEELAVEHVAEAGYGSVADDEHLGPAMTEALALLSQG